MRVTRVLVALAWVVAAAPGRAPAQSTFDARLSADTVEMGQVFELLVRVPVPAGSTVWFPDTVATTAVVESHRPVRWTADDDGSGGATLTLTYPVISYGAGIVPVSGFDVLVSPARARTGASLPGGSVVGTWGDAPPAGSQGIRTLRVPRRGLWVNPVFTAEQIAAGVEPLASNDVVGWSWHWPSVLLGLLFTGLLVTAATRAARPWLVARSAGARHVAMAWTSESSCRHALAELDALLAEGLHTTGRTHELYTRSSGIVRRHLQRVDPAYGADLTGSEVIGRLRARVNGHEGEPPLPTLLHEMGTAEVVKFGRLRPPGVEAEAHLRSLRAWLGSPGQRAW